MEKAMIKAFKFLNGNNHLLNTKLWKEMLKDDPEICSEVLRRFQLSLLPRKT